MSTTPGVVAAGVAFRAPFDDQPSENAFWAAQRRRGSVLGVGAGIFAALQTQVLAGREFSSQEISSNSMVAMLNVSGVRALWPSGTISEALGRDVPTTSGARRLIGIVEDIARDTSSAVTPTLFLPITASEVRAASRSLTVLVRMQPGHGPDRTPIDRLLYERLGPGSVDLESMVSRRAVQLERPRFVALVFGVLAFFSVLMVAVATFALGHLHATRLGREAAIRVAVGMAPARLRLWVLAQGLMPTLFGTVIGLGCSWILFRLAPGHLLGVNPPRWSGYMISALTFALLMFPVSWLSSRRLFTGAPVDLLRAP
jgi:hypothetical protein